MKNIFVIVAFVLPIENDEIFLVWKRLRFDPFKMTTIRVGVRYSNSSALIQPFTQKLLVNRYDFQNINLLEKCAFHSFIGVLIKIN